MRRLFWLLALALSLPAVAYAQVSLSEKTAENKGYPPGTVVVRPVVIAYGGPGPAEFSSRVRLPESWRLINGRQAVSFRKVGSELLLVSFFIPRNAAAGESVVLLTLEGAGGSIVETTLPVLVLAETRLRCSLLEQPDYILAGAAYQAVFLCANDGNVPLTVNILATSGSSFDARAEASRLRLLPGESVKVAVVVDTPIDLYAQVRHMLRMELRAVEDESVKASAASIVDILPRTTGKESRYNSISGKVSARGVVQHGESDTFGFEGEISGQGFLDEDESTFLAFKAHEPLLGAGTLIPDQNEYFLKVTGPAYSVAAGTQFFSLSPLTESSKLGSGVAVTKAFGSLGLSGFTMDNKLYGKADSRSGGTIDYRFGDRGTAAFNLLEAAGDGRWTAGSVEGHFLTGAGNRLEWEYASSRASRSDDALLASFGGSSDGFSYFFKYLRAGPEYKGSLADMANYTASFSYSPSRNVRLRATLGSKEYKLGQLFPDRLDSSQLGLSWSALAGTQLSADFLRSAALEREAEKRVDKESVRLSALRSSGAVNFGLSYEFGSRLEARDSRRTYAERLSVSVKGLSASLGSIEAALGVDLRDEENAKSPFSDIAISWEKKLGGRAVMSVKYRTVNSLRTYYQGADTVSARLGLWFPNQSELSMSADYGPSRVTGSVEDIKFSLGYSSPFQIPVSVKKNIGRIEGKVTDAVTGKALSDVVLRIDAAVAVTDPFGHYRFHSLYPGKSRMYIDPASLPDGYIPTESMPLEINVEGDAVTKDIFITKASTVSGRIVRYRFDHNFQSAEAGAVAAYVDPQGMPGVMLSMEGPGGVRKALSGEAGVFVFASLKPGSWVLRIPSEAVPEGSFSERSVFEFRLEPGQAEEATIKIFPKARQIRFIDQGTVIEEDEAAADDGRPSEAQPAIVD